MVNTYVYIHMYVNINVYALTRSLTYGCHPMANGSISYDRQPLQMYISICMSVCLFTHTRFVWELLLKRHCSTCTLMHAI